ncbi:hypothetical protein NDU88_004195 [Pleurodeles waltl]|uniref:Secreted protein n=1 Tax=Pleurodeles waltl TaxID=8319 RepID=A0AAV7L0R7_PLEWA|nr:hypothetical protein NDU88_004195 [Pleurodeles waltl]
MFRFVLLLSPFVAKVSEPLVSFNEWCGGPHPHGTFVSSQPRAAAATGFCSVAAAILGHGSREVVGESFPGKLCPKVDRCGLYSCCIFSDPFSSVFKTSGRYYARIKASGLDCGPGAPYYTCSSIGPRPRPPGRRES